MSASLKEVELCACECEDNGEIVSGAIAQVRTAPWIFLPEEDGPQPQPSECTDPDLDHGPGSVSSAAAAETHSNTDVPHTSTPTLEGEN